MSKYAKNTKQIKQIKKVAKVIESEPKKTEAEEIAIKLANKIFTQLSFRPNYHFISKVITTYIFYKLYRNPDYVKYRDGFNIQLNVILQSSTSEYDKLHINNFISYMDEKKSIELLFLNLLNYSKNDTENFSKMMKSYLSQIVYNKFIFQYISKALLYLLSVNPNPEKERQCIQYGELIDLSINSIMQELFPKLLNIKITKEYFDTQINSFFKIYKSQPINNANLDEIQNKYDTMNLEELRNQDDIINLECFKLASDDQIAFKTEGFASNSSNDFSKNIQTLFYIRKRKNIIKEQQKEQIAKEAAELEENKMAEKKSEIKLYLESILPKNDFKIKVCDCHKNYPKKN